MAGLATAVALRASGRPSRLLDAGDRDGEGFGLLLMPNGQRALERLGLGDEARRAGTEVRHRRDLRPGEEPEEVATVSIEPHLVLPRPALIGLLEAALPAGTVESGSVVSGVSPRAATPGAVLTTADGVRHAADLVVAADGTRSVLRDATLGPLKPRRRFGEVLARVHEPDVHDRLDSTLHKWTHPDGGRAVGLAPGPDGDVFFYLQVDTQRHEPPPTGASALEAWLDAVVGDWSTDVGSVLGAMDPTTATWKISTDADPLATYVAGRVVLVGDAAHPMLTLSTQGASTALEDALELVAAIDGHDDVDEALRAYDRRRTSVGADRVRRGRLRHDNFVLGASMFDDIAIDRELLRERAFNHRWAMQPPDVIPLTAADPDFDAPPVVREAITDHVAKGPLSYGPPDGLPSFRDAVAAVMRERRDVPVSAEGVIAADSAASGMYVMARWLLRPGDEAIVFDPVDYLFVSSVEAAGGTVVRCPLDPETGRFDADELAGLVTDRTRMLGVCNPHNPLGRVLDDTELEVLGELAVRHDLFIMNDEVWADVVFAPHVHRNIASVSPEVAARTVTVGGFSKSFGLAGLRIGYLATTDPAVRDQLFAASQAESTAWGAATLSQVAATAAYTDGWPWFASFLEHLTHLRDLGVERLDAIPGVRCRAPEGTYLLFPDITGLGVDAETLVEHVHTHGRVAVVPGTAKWFGTRATGHVRIAFPTSEAIFTEGLDRFERAVAAL